MADFIIIVILLCIVGSSSFYLYKAKKRGTACIGCPCSKQCKSQESCRCSTEQNHE